MAFSRFHRLLAEKIKAAAEAHGDSILCGQAKDYAEYRDGCGYIRGLNDALRLCEDIEGDLSK